MDRNSNDQSVSPGDYPHLEDSSSKKRKPSIDSVIIASIFLFVFLDIFLILALLIFGSTTGSFIALFAVKYGIMIAAVVSWFVIFAGIVTIIAEYKTRNIFNQGRLKIIIGLLIITAIPSSIAIGTLSQYITMNSDPSESVKAEVNMNTYDEVKRAIDACQIRTIAYYPYSDVGSDQNPKNLYLYISASSDTSGENVQERNLNLPFSDRDRVISDAKKSRGICKQAIGYRAFPDERDSPGNSIYKTLP